MPKEYTDEKLEALYKSVKGAWEADEGDPEDFDWEVLAGEIEDLPNHNTHDPNADRYHYDVRLALYRYWHKVIKGRQYSQIPYARIAESVREYEKKRGTLLIPAPAPFVRVERVESHHDMEKEYKASKGLDDESDEDDDIDALVK
jgi:hypothetical protein